MSQGAAVLTRKLSPPRHELWASIETVIKSQCKGIRKAPAFKYSSTRTYHIPATGGELIVQIYPKNCMISHGSIVFSDIPRQLVLKYLKAFISEKNLKHN